MLDAVGWSAHRLPGIGITRVQRFLKFGIIAVNIVEKSNLIFLVHRSCAIDNQGGNFAEASDGVLSPTPGRSRSNRSYPRNGSSEDSKRQGTPEHPLHYDPRGGGGTGHCGLLLPVATAERKAAYVAPDGEVLFNLPSEALLDPHI